MTKKMMQQVQAEDRDRIVDINHDFYEKLWSQTKLYGPENFNTWELLESLCKKAPRRLEVGPGLRPRLPIEGTVFLDLSQVACDKLNEAGGQAQKGTIESLDFPPQSFDLICIFDVIEHIADDEAVFAQLEELLVDGGSLFFSVPLHSHAWTDFDTLVGHFRRYDPDDLKKIVDDHSFDLEKSVVYGMQPKSKLLSGLGAWYLRKHYDFAMCYYNRYFFPLGLKRQKKLVFEDGLASDADIDEVLVICKRRPRG
ncbi:MAG: SAM-dependent methyltransferase [Verrucomicrobiales bacterium]|jgi:SAM-dependent methyltransferase